MLPVILPALLPVLGDILGRVIPDPTARDKAIADIFSQLQTSDLAQMEVNKVEAANSNIFVAGWRPAVGWVCVLAFAWASVGLPMGIYVSSFFDPKYATALLNAPKLDNNLWELLFAMLGVGGLRTFEKLKGVAR